MLNISPKDESSAASDNAEVLDSVQSAFLLSLLVEESNSEASAKYMRHEEDATAKGKILCLISGAALQI